MCSELTPRARIPDTRIPQLMQPCIKGFLALIVCLAIVQNSGSGHFGSEGGPFNKVRSVGVDEISSTLEGVDACVSCRIPALVELDNTSLKSVVESWWRILLELIRVFFAMCRSLCRYHLL